MKIKVSEASGRVLDYLVAQALGHAVKVRTWQEFTDTLDPVEDADTIAFHREHNSVRISSQGVPGAGWFPVPGYSADWTHGGPILQREQINLDQFKGHPCRAHLGTHVQYEHAMFAPEGLPLVAAMRCYVASKLGDEVEVPDELVNS